MSETPTRKMLALLLAVVLLIPVLTGCSKSSGAIELEAKNTIEEETLAQITQYTNDSIGALLTKNTYAAFSDYRAQGQILVNPPFDNSLAKRWSDFVAQHGEVKSAVASETEAHEDGFVSHLVLTGEDDEMMRLNISYSKAGNPFATTLESYADDSNMTFGQKMAQAGMNTLVGLLVVFAVLILLSLIISAFKFIGAAESRLAKNSAPAKAAAAAPASSANLMDDKELVAVIAAAVAASENISTDDFVVSSITRA